MSFALTDHYGKPNFTKNVLGLNTFSRRSVVLPPSFCVRYDKKTCVTLP
jgi:hypothetical protein